MDFIDVTCPSCKTNIHINSKLKECFCNNCGAKISLNEDHEIMSYVDRDNSMPHIVPKQAESYEEPPRKDYEPQNEPENDYTDAEYEDMLDSIEIPPKFGSFNYYGKFLGYAFLLLIIGGLVDNNFWYSLALLVFAIPSAIHLFKCISRHNEIVNDLENYKREQVKIRYFDNHFKIGEPVKTCKHCKKLISEDAKICPYCRKKQRIIWPAVVLIIIILLLVPSYNKRKERERLYGSTDTTTTTTTSTAQEETETPTEETTETSASQSNVTVTDNRTKTSESTSSQTTPSSTATQQTESAAKYTAYFDVPQVVYEENGITVTLTGMTDSSSAINASFEVSNSSETDYSVSAHSYALNNIMMGDTKYGFGSVDVPAGKKAKMTLAYDKNLLYIFDVSKIVELEQIFWVYGESMKDWNSELIKIQSTDFDESILPAFDAENAAYDDKYMTVWYVGNAGTDSLGNKCYGILLHNKTDYNGAFTFDNASINDWSYDLTSYTFDLFDELIQADSYAYVKFPIDNKFKNEYGISSVDQISFTVKLESDYYKRYSDKFETTSDKIVMDIY